MNKERRKKIEAIKTRLDGELRSLIDEIQNEIQEMLDAEQEAYDNMSEGMQNAERGEKAQEAITNLEAARDALDSSDVEDAIGALEEAMA